MGTVKFCMTMGSSVFGRNVAFCWQFLLNYFMALSNFCKMLFETQKGSWITNKKAWWILVHNLHWHDGHCLLTHSVFRKRWTVNTKQIIRGFFFSRRSWPIWLRVGFFFLNHPVTWPTMVILLLALSQRGKWRWEAYETYHPWPWSYTLSCLKICVKTSRLASLTVFLLVISISHTEFYNYQLLKRQRCRFTEPQKV